MNNYRGFELKNDNVIVEKSENFAVRIVRLYQFLCDEKKSLFFQSNCFAVAQVLVQIFTKQLMAKANWTLFIN